MEQFATSINEFILHFYVASETNIILKPKNIANDDLIRSQEASNLLIKQGLSILQNIQHFPATENLNKIIEFVTSSILKCHHYISETLLEEFIQMSEVSSNRIIYICI